VRLVDAGEQFIKSSANAHGGAGVNDGTVEYSVMEYTTTARSWYTNGVDVHQGARWIIRHNLFRNLRAPDGQLAGPAVLMWNRSRDTLVEGNLFLNVQYGVALGLDPGRADDHRGGIVRNNIVHRGAHQTGDVGIVVNNSAGTKVLHNTIVLNGTYPNAIEYRFAATTDVEIRYNLADARVRPRDGASGLVTDNVTDAPADWFVDAAASISRRPRPAPVTARGTIRMCPATTTGTPALPGSPPTSAPTSTTGRHPPGRTPPRAGSGSSSTGAASVPATRWS
jgi:hypothetical protein